MLSSSVSYFIPKQPDLVVFGAMKGDDYGDNGQHLFEWMLYNRPEARCVWLTHSKKVYDNLRSRGLPVYRTDSLRGILTVLRASAGVYTNSLRDLAAYPDMIPNSIQLIALRHGRSVKRVRFARMGDRIDETEAGSRQREGDLIRYAISTSDFISDMQEECLQIGREKHVVTGYPRNDALLDVPEPYLRRWKDYLDDANQPKVVLYAPTWRHGRIATRFFPFDDFNEQDLVATLKSNRAILLLRPHVRDLETYPQMGQFLAGLAEHDCILLATHREFPDANSLLPFVDVLVSDYSAIYHDFLLLDRAMLFIPYDYDDFERQNGFLYSYFENLPGPAVHTFGEFKDRLEAALSGHEDYAEKRATLRDKVHIYKDTKSRMRVADLLGSLIKVG